MKNYYRFSKKRIVEVGSKTPISEKIIFINYKRGLVGSYVDGYSKEDLLPALIKRYQTGKYADRYSKKAELELGPSVPLMETKYYVCQDCDNPTPNRFRCGPCWEKISHVSAGVFDELDFELMSGTQLPESFE
jgi:hypothetical protein